MPGVVAQSTEWSKLYDHITHFGNDRIIAGDYGCFDKHMTGSFILNSFWIYTQLMKKAKMSEKHIQRVWCIGNDIAYACIDFNGDLMELLGNPSGNPITVILNCTVNSLYMRYAFMLTSKKKLNNFQNYVKLATYGDDNIMGVSKECPEFNHTSISEALNTIGVIYTMADKEAKSIPYINIKDGSFLKRSFVFDNDIGTIVAPLELSSFDKMLTARLPKADMAAEAHAICVIETAQREYFFHGKEKFFERQKFFHQLVEDCGLQSWVRESTFPNYYDMIYEFWMKYGDVENAMLFSKREHTQQSLIYKSPESICGEKTLNRSEVLSTQQNVTNDRSTNRRN